MRQSDVTSEVEQIAHNTNLRRLIEVERAARTISGETSSDHLRRLAEMVSELARCGADLTQSIPSIQEQRSHIETHGELERRLSAIEGDPESPVEASILEPGQQYELVIRVRATVVERQDSHGLCYKVLVDQRDYVEPRMVDLDADEISSAIRLG